MALEVIGADRGAVNYHKVVLEEATPEDRKERQEPQLEEPVVKRRPRKRQSQIAEKEHRGEELGRRRAEVHSQQQAKRAQPTAGENQKNRQSSARLQAETYEENNVSKKEVGPTTRDKYTESHRHMAAEQELKIAEKGGEHQVEIEESNGVEE